MSPSAGAFPPATPPRRRSSRSRPQRTFRSARHFHALGSSPPSSWLMGMYPSRCSGYLGIRQRIIARIYFSCLFLNSRYTSSCACIVRYSDRPSFPLLNGKGGKSLPGLSRPFATLDRSLFAGRPSGPAFDELSQAGLEIPDCSADFHEPRPLSRKPRLGEPRQGDIKIVAASRGCSRGSIGLAFIEAFMPFILLLPVTGLAKPYASSSAMMAPCPSLRTSPKMLR